MAAKDDAAILKHLKKNPSQEALDISFATDIDESVVNESLAALYSKGQVEYKDVGGRPQWSLAAAKPKPAPAPKAEKPAPAPKAVATSSSDFDDEETSGSSGSGKGFVLGVGVIVLVLAILAGYVLGGMQASASAKALADGEIKSVRDSIGLVKMSLNLRIDNLESQIREIKAAAEKAQEAKASEAKAPASKPAKKKKRRR